MQEVRYASDKPSDCRKCFFWNENKSGCGLGKDNCYYLINVPEKVESECDDCPYGRDHLCIGWCTKKILRELDIR